MSEEQTENPEYITIYHDGQQTKVPADYFVDYTPVTEEEEAQRYKLRNEGLT